MKKITSPFQEDYLTKATYSGERHLWKSGLSRTIRIRAPENAMGQRVLNLFNGKMEAGYNRLRFDWGEIPSGVDFLTLKSGGLSLTERVIYVY